MSPYVWQVGGVVAAFDVAAGFAAAVVVVALVVVVAKNCIAMHTNWESVELALSTAHTNAPILLPFVLLRLAYVSGVDCLFSAGEWKTKGWRREKKQCMYARAVENIWE